MKNGDNSIHMYSVKRIAIIFRTQDASEKHERLVRRRLEVALSNLKRNANVELEGEEFVFFLEKHFYLKMYMRRNRITRYMMLSSSIFATSCIFLLRKNIFPSTA